ncbi:MAG TPA: hypothetical protein QGF58_25705 [Myxococcota bacterium]|nr:hypothetical protein [Myxococcota bacterium]
MSRWLKALAKAGLVDLTDAERERVGGGAGPADPEEIERILAESRALESGEVDLEADTDPALEPPEPPPVHVEPLVDVQSGVPLDQVYDRLGVTGSPYPAEKLLTILDAMKALDPAARKAAILAMDTAEPTWTISDPLLDADRKMEALRTAQAELDATVAEAETKAADDLSSQDQYKEKASTEIRKQIADLEALLAQELQDVADAKAQVNVRLAETRNICTQERARYEAEIDRLKTLNVTFPQES